jgi:hypothetical protein
MTRYDIVLGKLPSTPICGGSVPIYRDVVSLDLKEGDNPITFVARNWWLAIGTGGQLSAFNTMNNTTPFKLFKEVFRKRLTPENIEWQGSNTVDFSCTLTEPEAVGSLNEMGLIDTFGNLLSYKAFEVVNKTESMSLTLQYRIQF